MPPRITSRARNRGGNDEMNCQVTQQSLSFFAYWGKKRAALGRSNNFRVQWRSNFIEELFLAWFFNWILLAKPSLRLGSESAESIRGFINKLSKKHNQAQHTNKLPVRTSSPVRRFSTIIACTKILHHNWNNWLIFCWPDQNISECRHLQVCARNENNWKQQSWTNLRMQQLSYRGASGWHWLPCTKVAVLCNLCSIFLEIFLTTGQDLVQSHNKIGFITFILYYLQLHRMESCINY